MIRYKLTGVQGTIDGLDSDAWRKVAKSYSSEIHSIRHMLGFGGSHVTDEERQKAYNNIAELENKKEEALRKARACESNGYYIDQFIDSLAEAIANKMQGGKADD